MLVVEDIHVFYGDNYVIQGLSLEVNKGEIVALLGRNGAGKTTTLNAIMGFVKPRSGKISFKGVDITGLSTYTRARLGIGYVPQGRRLFTRLTVLENLKTGFTGKPNKQVLSDIFELFPTLKERLNQVAGTLSGGEQQMLAIARALTLNADFLLMDEPTTGLMPTLVSKLKQIIEKLNEKGITILLVEQNVPLALEISDRAYIIEKGQVKYSGESKQLRKKEDILRSYIGVKV